MTPERFAELREIHEKWDTVFKGGESELFAHIDDLTRQLESARNMVVQSRFFQNTEAEWYEPSYPGDHMPDVGPVAWDKQVRQT